MSDRITEAHLEKMCDYINQVTGMPAAPYGPAPDFTANIGNFHVEAANGGYGLSRISSPGGGTTDPLGLGSGWTRRELYNLMRAFVRGLEFQAKEKR